MSGHPGTSSCSLENKTEQGRKKHVMLQVRDKMRITSFIMSYVMPWKQRDRWTDLEGQGAQLDLALDGHCTQCDARQEEGHVGMDAAAQVGAHQRHRAWKQLQHAQIDRLWQCCRVVLQSIRFDSI